jgi:hypothetical protein
MKMERTGSGAVIAAAVLVFGWASAAGAQTPAGVHAQIQSSSFGLVTIGSRAQGETVREIDDPHTGARWLLVRDEWHPGGPGRLVLMGLSQEQKKTGTRSRQGTEEEARLGPVIFAGDRLIVEEHTARLDATLEARALSPAAPGAEFDARLTMGGKVVRAVALGPGHAALRPETGVR